MRGGIIAFKTIWYILRTVIVIAIIAGLLYFSFNTAMGMANIYIITTDGMKKRADVVLGAEDATELVEYFSARILDNDPLLLSGKYADYTIKSYDYKIKVEKVWALPWKDTGTITVTERVQQMDGEMLKEKIPEGQEASPLPEWESFRYEITLQKNENGRYFIDKIDKLEQLHLTGGNVPSVSGASEISITPAVQTTGTPPPITITE